MASNNNSSAVGGVGFLGLLQLVFIVLKLCKVIDWSWWLVLIPLWVEIGVVILVFAIAIIAAVRKD